MRTPHLLLFAAATALSVSSCRKLDKEVDFDAAYVVNGGSNSITVINLTTLEVHEELKLRNAEFPHHIYLSPDKKELSVGVPGVDMSGSHSHSHSSSDNTKGKILLLKAENLKRLEREKTAPGAHNAIFSSDGSEVWTATTLDGAGSVQVFDAGRLKEKTAIPVGNSPLEVTFNTFGTVAFVCNSADATVTAIARESKQVMATIPVGTNPVGAWPGADNRMYVDNEGSQTITIIDAGTLTVTATMNLGFTPGYVAHDASRNELWVSDPDRGQVRYYTASGNSWTEQGTVVTGAGAHAIALTGSNEKILVTNQDAGTVTVIDASAKTKIKDITVGSKPNGIAVRMMN